MDETSAENVEQIKETAKEEGKQEVYKEWEETERAKRLFDELYEVRQIAIAADIKASLALTEVVELEEETQEENKTDTKTVVKKEEKESDKTEGKKEPPKMDMKLKRRRYWGG